MDRVSRFRGSAASAYAEAPAFAKATAGGPADESAGGLDDITDYSVGVTYAMKWFNTEVRFHDTDGPSAGCRRICDSRVVVKVSRSF